MAAADAPTPVPSSPAEQLTAPPGWTKKLVPARAKNATLRKHDVVFIAPDGREIPSQWHLRRYLKSHPGEPGVSDFDWSSGEESIRRSGRASVKEVSYSERSTRGKRNASEMDAGGPDEGKDKTPIRKRAKKSEEVDLIISEEKGVPIEDELMHEVQEAVIGGIHILVQDSTEPAIILQTDDVDIATENAAENAMEEHVAVAEEPVNVTDSAIYEKPIEKEVIEHAENVPDLAKAENIVVEESTEQVVIVTNGVTDEKTIVEVFDLVVNSADVRTIDKKMVDKVTEEVLDHEVTEEVLDVTDLASLDKLIGEEVKEQVEEVRGLVEEMEDQVKKVMTSANLHLKEVESKEDIGDTASLAPSNGLSTELPVVDSVGLQEPAGKVTVEFKNSVEEILEVDSVIVEPKLVDQNLEEDGAFDESEKLVHHTCAVTDAAMEELNKSYNKNLEAVDALVVESQTLLDASLEIKEDSGKVTPEIQEQLSEGEKSPLEPLMQKEEQERLSSAHNPPLKVDHVRENSPSEICSSPAPLSVSNQ